MAGSCVSMAKCLDEIDFGLRCAVENKDYTLETIHTASLSVDNAVATMNIHHLLRTMEQNNACMRIALLLLLLLLLLRTVRILCR